jgi:DhnA family fructose-bisphosphate aldolase class Ia
MGTEIADKGAGADAASSAKPRSRDTNVPTLASYGAAARVAHLRNPTSGRIVLLTLDATLFSGPESQVARPSQFLNALLADAPPDALLGFPGLFLRAVPPDFGVGRIVNGTASTTFDDPAHKVPTLAPAGASAMGADAVGLHIVFGHPKSYEMLERAAELIADFSLAGIPVMVAAYVAGENSNAREIAHAARIAVDLGASIVKTAFTGDAKSYAHVAEALDSVPLLVAGGPFTSVERGLQIAHDAVIAGAAGVAFGRCVFESESPALVLRALRRIVHEDSSVRSALRTLAA